jgi:purine-binding chemotaxis protein CheW
MVDMVEARKRAKAKLKVAAGQEEAAIGPPSSPFQAKPVLRSEAPTPEDSPAYFPMDLPPQQESKTRKAQPLIVAPEPVPAVIVPEDQVNFLQRLFEDTEEEEETQEEAAGSKAIEELELLIFQLGKERYGIDIQQIAEIIRFVEPTQVPNTIGFLDGIISLRGKMIPVINGRRRLGHDPKAPDKKSRIVVLSDSSEIHGILVDSASQVVRLPKDDIEPTPSVVVGIDAEFIEGVCEHKGQLIILLNLNRFLQFN